MKKVLVIALSIFSISAYAAHTNAHVTAEQAIKGVASGAIIIGMTPKQIQNVLK
ncbi:hypothetical protein JCM19238_3514 [Vibrio ponticus]|jgi:hypothetical protein|uniref:hypothetical protein n=1 Tax=Vibrio TaxID=662 RepID=UPI0005002721|nr:MULTISPECIES: hypothetical protein [Vibrio]GAK85924.1 hypothetical protein JCM19238_3514 [Vibrio ponticus]